MSSKIAVAVIHGIGVQPADFAANLIQSLVTRVRSTYAESIVVAPVHWSPVTQGVENVLRERVVPRSRFTMRAMRHFMIDFLADGVAYQITPFDRTLYDLIHAVFADTLRLLAQEAGAEAPLVVMAHSLGTIIASNFLYDLQTDLKRPIISQLVRERMGNTPLERGETLAAFYTFGSPLALWSLRYDKFGKPIDVPSPRLRLFHPEVVGEWVNYYDVDDAIGFPLKNLNDEYQRVVTEDRAVNVGGVLSSWNPLSHMRYWSDANLLDELAERLIRLWWSAYGGGI